MKRKNQKSSYLLIIILLLILNLIDSCISYAEDKKDDIWVSMEERKKIWDSIAGKGKYTISPNGIEATFKKDWAKWTIIGANAPIVNPTIYPNDWPVKGDDFAVLVIPEPITNYKILPFTEPIENAIKSDTISITAAPDSYGPASFVIRSGNTELSDVMIEVTDLKAEIKKDNGEIEKVIIPKKNIDIRVVKCWYQAGIAINDIKHKLLTPELLLHNDDLVRVDYQKQVNILKNLEKIQDAEQLMAFNIPKNHNKQIWLTAHITEEFLPGKYHGSINITVGKNTNKELTLEIEVLPFILPEPMLEYALYYEGNLSGQKEPKIGWRPKTEEQMLYELIDMKAHGLTNATVWHQVNDNQKKWEEDWKRLKRTLELRSEIGWGKKPLLYLDWKTSFGDDLNIYKDKIKTIISIAQSFGIHEVFIYGKDERKGKELLALRSQYKAVHEAGARNFVACTEDFINYVPTLLDLPVLPGKPKSTFMTSLYKLGIKAWSYANPQTGLEEPETYRHNYGIKLLTNGFSGACDYVYQHGSCWNDFVDNKYRSHTMAYPTINKPIPTIQWEGWREGVDDVRYVTLLKNKDKLTGDWLNKECSSAFNDFRKNAVNIILNEQR